MTHKSNKTKFLLLQLLFLFGMIGSLNAQVYVPFTQRTSSYTPTKTVYNVKGDFTMIGNTNLTLQNYGATTNNNNNTMVYVDVDGNSITGLGGSPTFNSSSADLTLSTENGAIPSCSRIVFAGLYWTGRANQSGTASNTFSVTKTIGGTSYTKTFDKRKALLKGPGATAYTTLQASSTNIYYPTSNGDYIYSGYAEITDYVRQYGLGSYTVADLALRDGNGGGTGYSGGWGIIVVYENSKMKYRDVTIFDGHAYMNGSSTTNLPVSGFNTVQTGNVGIKLGMMASEGDVNLTGDFFRIRNLNTNNYTTLSHTGNSASNFFNSSIATGGNTRNPNIANNTGIDIAMFTLNNTNNTIIGNSQTSTNFQYGSGGDVYAIFNIAMAVDAYVPEQEGMLSVTQLNNVNVTTPPYSIQPGQDMTFSVEIKNLGTEAVNNTKIVIPIPYNTTYVTNSASGSVLFTPLPSPNTITFNPTLGATGSIVWDFGTLPLPSSPNQVLARLTFKLRATTDCTILNNTSCGNNIQINGTISGVGAITGVALNNKPLIQGYTTNGTCVGEPIAQAISIGINGTNYVNANCQGVPTVRNFYYCGAGTTVPVSDVASSFPTGSSFYNEYPVDSNTVEYNASNPFPIDAGTTVTYYAVPPGSTGCNIPFTISRCNKIIANDDSGTSIIGASGGTSFTNVLTNDTLNGNPVVASQVTVSQVSSTNSGVSLVGNNVVVAPGTPAGNYTLVYQICEVSNPTNCDTATVTVPVTAAVINAENDNGSANGYTGGTAVPNVLVNDTLNGQPVTLAQVNLTQVSTTNPNVTLDPATGAVNVAPGTPAGTYTLVYQICEILNPANCDTATVTVTVGAAPIIANDDAGTPVNGFAGGTSFTNVLVNDTLNGQPVLASQVNTTFVSSTNPGVTLVGTDVVVAAGTPVGNYTLVYQICEILNPTNCDTATVTVTVNAAPIVANDDSGSANGYTGGTAVPNVLVNDTLNGQPVTLAQVNLTQVSTTNPNVTLDPATGAVNVAPGTPAGTYTLVYQICEILNPANCDTATVTVTVGAAPIIANDDAGTPVNGFAGGTSFTNVLVNDTLNGQPVLASQVNTTFVSSTNPGVTLVGTDVVVAAGTPVGTYTLVYQICEILNPTNCDTATVTVTVNAAPIVANDDSGSANGYTGGTAVPNVLVNDTLNGQPVTLAQVNLTQVSTTNPNVTLDPATGAVNVAPGTPAGTYTLVYQICEILNPTNCDTATVTVTVHTAPIIANDDAGTPVNGFAGGTSFTNVLVNDTLNGQPVLAAQVNTTFVSSTNPGVTLVGTDVVVAAGTPAGTYTLVYQICEILNPTNCDTATVTVTVNAAPIVANDDSGSANGYTGGTAVPNVLVNDTLNGQPVTLAQVNLTQVSTTNPNVTLDPATGAVNVAPGTPAGTYTLVYQICEILNPTNCDTATVTVTVHTAPIIANDDAGTPVNGFAGGTSFTNVLVNDTLNGQPVLAAQVNTTFVSSTNPGVTLVGTDVVVAAGTPAGNYTLVYQICEILNPTNCDTATVTVTVNAAPIVANDDSGSANGYTGGTAVPNVLVNDTLNGQPVTLAQVNLTQVSTTNPNVTLDPATGAVNVAPGTPAGTYTLVYQICEILNSTNCDTATVTVTVHTAPIIANDDAGTPVNGFAGGTSFTNVLVNDTLNGQPVLAAQVNTTFVSSTNPGVTLVGTDVVVAAGTPAGNYTLVYQICEILNPTNCDTATVTVTVNAAPIVANDDTITALCSENGIFANAISNDTLNGIAIANGQVNFTVISGSATNVVIDSNGNISLSASGSCGTYTFTYQICETLNPNNCDTATITLTIQDTTAPTFVEATPANVTVECSNVPAAATLTATDNCGAATVTFNEVTAAGNCAGNYTLTRTWTATDACGNTTTATQVVTVQDTTAPTFVEATPANVTVECSNVPAAATLTATDNCGTANVTFNEVTAAGNCAGNYTLTRTWTATDACGNTTTATQVVTVQDTTAPTFVEATPANVTVECSNVPAAATLTATDNCGAATVTFNEVTAAGNCAGNYTLTRTWTATDACGNTTTATQVVTVQDTTAPTFVEATPANVTVECSNVPAAATLTATDNCGTANVTFNEVTAAGNCAGNYTITRTWTATDACGNTTTATQVVTVQDTTAPTFVEATPANVTVECSNVPAAATLTATDNCGTANVTFNEVTAAGNCAGNYTLTRTWTATDACGNTTTATQVVTVQDTTAPTFVEATPANVTVECSNVPAAATLTATDNCGAATVTFNEVTAAGNCAGNYTLTRTWTATDACGNTTTATQVVTVQDTTAPTFVEATPANVTVECSNVPAAATLTATDNCGAATVTFNEVTAAGNCAGNYTLTRTWTATDACGNTTTATQVVTVQDTTAPQITAQASNLVVECDGSGNTNTLQTWLANQGGASATDNCGNVIWTNNFSAMANDCSAAITVIFTATDACGNTATTSATFTIQDTVDPTFVEATPANVTVECSNVPAAATLTATDNCGTANVTFNEVTAAGNCAGNYTLTRTWTATDACGNTTTATQVVTVQDTTAPTFVEATPANVTVECSNVPAAATLTATDNCGAATVTFNEVTAAGNCAGNYTLTRTWTATDACGNTTTATQVVTVQDTTAPTFVEATPANVTVECSNVPAAATLTATDNCGTANVTFNEVTAAGNCAGNYTLTRTWTATDACGNTTTATQVVTVQDTTAPTFVEATPANVTVECSNVPAAATLTATDNCGTANVTFNEVTAAGNCAGNYTLTRTWTATDACGNTTTATQVVTVQDTTAPTFVEATPANVTVECSNVPAAATLTATDNCGAATVTFNEVTAAGNCAGNYTLTRTWTATDACGNTTTATQVVTVQDTTAPTFVEATPANVTVECSNVPAAATLTATDNCGAATVTFNEVTAAGNCAGNYTLTRTWTATDACGNTTTATQVVTVQDTTAPQITAQASNLVVECDGSGNTNTLQTWLANQGGASATDNCGNVIWTNNFSAMANDCSAAITVIFTATDACGNTATTSATFTIQDTVDPTFVEATPANVTVECSNVPAAATLTATDNCGTANVTFNEVTAAGNCAGNYTLTRTWTATDACGNTTTATQVVTVQDTTAPTFVEATPANVTVECSNVPAAATLTATDNCGAATVTFNEVTAAGNCAGNYTLTRTWTATDACGNTTTATQVVTVQDTTAPTFVEATPANVTVECSNVPAAATLTATDNCGTANVTFNEVTAAGNCAGNYTITRTWTATDACGNTTTATQVVTVQDTTAPTFVEATPANVTVECSNVPAAATLTATDNCGTANVTFNEVTAAGNCAGNYTLTRTWTATDACGNTTTATQVVTVQDTTAPTFVEATPANVTVECSNVPAAATLTATDNCGTANVTFNEVTAAGNCAGNYTLTRTWTATDACGNTTTATQVVTVQDTTAPTFVEATPANVTVECSNVPAAATLTATDNCGAATVTFNEVTAAGNCAGNYTLTRTWTATDACGNTTTATQVVTVQDTTAPTFVEATPANVTVECSNVPAAATLTATDNCGAATVTFNEVTAAGNCAGNYTLTRTWTATDACGNTTTATQVVTVQDTTAPQITAQASNLVVECDGSGNTNTLQTWLANQGGASATDNCGNVIWTNNFSAMANDCSAAITVIFTATDACGNTATTSATFTIQDTVDPTFVEATPANVTVECSNVPAAATLTATDNCGTANVTFNEVTAAGNCAGNYTLTRTWTATDACGNTTTATQVVTVQDTTAPTFVEATPANVTVECSNVPAAATLTATDNCGAATVTFNEVTAAGNCAGNYTLTRTWTATDACGNTTTATQVVTVQDTTAPTFVEALPTDVTVECTSIPELVELTATDNCGTATVTFNQTTVAGSCPNNYTLVRTWTGTDECGNTVTHSQNITVQDTTAPTFVETLPTDVTVECANVPAAATLTASDYCGTATVTFNEATTAGTCPGAYTITRTWTASDNCGNTTTHVQTITVQDTTAPVFVGTLPTNATAQCANVPSAATLTATDSCGAATVTFNETSTAGSCPSAYTITRTWTATDACGNTTTHTQIVNVVDTVAPQIATPYLAVVNVNCDAIPAVPQLQFTDNCSATVTVAYNETTSPTQNGVYTIVRTWTVSDACNNTNTYTQTVNVTLVAATNNMTYADVVCNNDNTLTINVANVILAQFPGTDMTSGVWTDVNNTGGLNTSTGVFNPYQIANGSYIIKYTLSNGTCPVEYAVTINVNENACIVLPCQALVINNALTPNGDGTNDYFIIENIEDTTCYPENTVEIYNRWGVKVFDTSNYDNESRVFRGVSEGRSTVNQSAELPTGTYFYILKYKNAEGNYVTKNGYLYLSR